jgi:ribosomal protein S18 acetylase RimI-like enzyme
MTAVGSASRVAWDRRPAEPSDDEFLCRLYGSTREDELALWNATSEQKEQFLRLQFGAQRAHYSRHFANSEHTIITIGGAPVGRTLVDRSGGDIHLVDIAILPEHRSAGIGTILMRELLDEAAMTGKAVRLQVWKPSRAVSFYERLGFRRAGDHQTHWALEWVPQASLAAGRP